MIRSSPPPPTNISSLSPPKMVSPSPEDGSVTPDGNTTTGKERTAVAVSSFELSLEVAVTVSSKPAPELSGIVSVRLLISDSAKDHLPPPRSVPLDSATPSGTPPISIGPKISEPSVSLRTAAILSLTVSPISPLAGAVVISGASAIALTLILNEAVSSPPLPSDTV